MKVFKEGDLVYSFASESFYIILEAHGTMAFSVYSMDATILEIIDVTITHVSLLSDDYKNKVFIQIWAID